MLRNWKKNRSSLGSQPTGFEFYRENGGHGTAISGVIGVINLHVEFSISEISRNVKRRKAVRSFQLNWVISVISIRSLDAINSVSASIKHR